MCAKKIDTHQQDFQLFQSALKPFPSVGFDTLRLGLPIEYKDYFSLHHALEQLCESIGATIHKVKYSNPENPTGKPLITNDKTLLRLFIKKYGRQSVRSKLFSSTGAWILEYKDVTHWIICWKNSKVFHFELYGLSQLDHLKGRSRFELLNKILDYYKAAGQVVELLGYDFAVDIQKTFDEALELLVNPFINLVIGKPKPIITEIIKDAKGSRTVYLQKYKEDSHYVPNRRYVVYDKKGKNSLDFLECLTRFEVKVHLKSDKRVLLQSYEDLYNTYMFELKSLFIITAKEYSDYHDKKTRLLSEQIALDFMRKSLEAAFNHHYNTVRCRNTSQLSTVGSFTNNLLLA